MTKISKKRTVARIRWRGGRKASATCVKVAGIGTSNIKAKELDSRLGDATALASCGQVRSAARMAPGAVRARMKRSHPRADEKQIGSPRRLHFLPKKNPM
jgi:hypothetical protein